MSIGVRASMAAEQRHDEGSAFGPVARSGVGVILRTGEGMEDPEITKGNVGRGTGAFSRGDQSADCHRSVQALPTRQGRRTDLCRGSRRLTLRLSG